MKGTLLVQLQKIDTRANTISTYTIDWLSIKNILRFIETIVASN